MPFARPLDDKSEVPDLKGVTAGVQPVSATEVDLSKIEVPADVVAVVEGDAEPVVPAKKPTRAKKAPVKAE